MRGRPLLAFALRPAVWQFGATAASHVIMAATGFITTAFIARYVSSEEFGYYQFALVIAAYVYIFSDSGAITATMIEYQRRPETSVLAVLIHLTLFAVAIVVCTVTLLTGFGATSIAFLIVAVVSGFTLRSLAPDWLLVLEHRYLLASVCRVLPHLALLLLLFMAASGALLAWYSLLVGVAAYTLTALVAFAPVARRGVLARVHPLMAGSFYVRSLPLAAAAVVVQVFWAADVLAVSYFVGAGQSADYFGAYRAAQFEYSLLLLLLRVSLPRLVSIRSETVRHSHGLRSYSMLLVSAAGGGIAVTLISVLLAEPLMNLMLGDGLPYQSAADLLRIMISAFWIGTIGWACLYILLALNQRLKYLIATSAAAIVQLISAVVLTALFGRQGAALSNIIANVTLLLFAFFLLKSVDLNAQSEHN
jgi:O-antigen/teichoic acid export membrane protein